MDPLQVCEINPITHRSLGNKGGRPPKGERVLFGPQPQSHISKILREIKEPSKIILPIESHQWSQDSVLISVSDNEDCYHEDNHSSPANKDKRLQNEPKVVLGDKQFTCDFLNCNYACKLSSNLIKHKRTHTDEKPYLCDMCSFQSKFVNSFKAHRRIHTNERPYKCNFCSYRCNSSSNLKKHCKHRHTKSLESS